MAKHPDLASIITNPKFQTQIIYTQIDRDKNGRVSFTNYKYQVDSNLYFYPASMVKMPTAFLALQRLNEININEHTALKIGADRFAQSAVSTDSTALNGLPTIANYIKKIFVVSDNDAFNRLYEFLGQDYINTQLHSKAFTDSFIKHRLVGGYYGLENQYINPIWFYDKNKQVIYEQPGSKSSFDYSNQPVKSKLIRGKGYYDDASKNIVWKPFDFSKKNSISLLDLHEQMQRILFPAAFEPELQFHLSKQQYEFLYEVMCMLPRNSGIKEYENLPDNYTKNILFGDEDKSFRIPDHIRIFNKAGWAYGFMTETAYIVNERDHVEFMLSVQLLVNENDIFNDGEYQYESIGSKFMGRLGKVIYDFDKCRDRI